MGSNVQEKFQKRRKTAEDTAKKQKGYESLLKAIKDSSKLEKALGAVDKALDAKDAPALHTAYADFKPLAARYRGQVAAELTKLKKKSSSAEDNDAYGDAVMLVGELQTQEQILPDKVKKVLSANESTKHHMQTTGLLGEWVGLKRLFEAETGKKKPSESFMKAFRSSSGLENAFKAIDLSTKKNDVVALEKAYHALEKTITDYGKVVLAQAKVAVNSDDVGGDDDNQNPSYQDAVKKLLQGLNRLRLEAKQVLDDAK